MNTHKPSHLKVLIIYVWSKMENSCHSNIKVREVSALIDVVYCEVPPFRWLVFALVNMDTVQHLISLHVKKLIFMCVSVENKLIQLLLISHFSL